MHPTHSKGKMLCSALEVLEGTKISRKPSLAARSLLGPYSRLRAPARAPVRPSVRWSPPPGRARSSFHHYTAVLQEQVTDRLRKDMAPMESKSTWPSNLPCTPHAGLLSFFIGKWWTKQQQICFHPKGNQRQRNKMVMYFAACPP